MTDIVAQYMKPNYNKHGRVKTKFHYAVQLASWFANGLQPASELDSVMEFGL